MLGGLVDRARHRRVRRRLAGPKLIRAMGRAFPEAFFIEIGSNDGEQHDHLRPMILRRAWRGIMVEPVPYVFERLRANYGSLDRIALENAAIADRDGELPFYHLRAPEADERERLPDWYDGTGSFSRETILAHAAKIPDLERRLVETKVRCLSFESLCRKHGVQELDLLAIDAEGYDDRILHSIDLEARRPRLLIFEHFHLTPGDREACERKLEAGGYETMSEGFDTFALDRRRTDKLSELWELLEPGVPAVSVADEGS